ncbi:hypothetical protein [Streptomyces ipomoeae]|uniref:hypothetical protein n=1 Tax=Streptomyces ipomoeae TaxID=103232 RepID=UPI0029ABAA75|nr:hypothetical protein [Streptomyces ipomoeae]MDX2700790.1 hypothetical protein [Streptomyces ipomoeae]MDX2845412.1 hypothetical protein [Streptomyces ipomoeae]
MSIQLAAGLEQYTTQSVTTAGFALGLALAGVEHWRWFKGGGGGAGKGKGAPGDGGAARDPKALIPYWSGVVFGVLMVACPAGLLGVGAGFFRWGGNGVGGWVMSTMTGHTSASSLATGAPGLNEYGAAVVTALVLALF